MTDCKKPLQGLKVLDFTRVYSGPYCTMMMGDLGADIIKVERKGVGDDTHYFGPMKNDESGYFTYFNRNKKSFYTIFTNKIINKERNRKEKRGSLNRALHFFRGLLQSKETVVCYNAAVY